MKINLNKNQKNKYINSSNLKIQLRNYNGTNPWSLALHECKSEIKIEEEIIAREREREKTELGPP